MQAGRICYPPGARAVIDVTAAPYFLDPTGQQDCTVDLVRILDDVLRAEVEGMRKIRAKLLDDPRPDVEIGFESRKTDGHLHIVFPEQLPEQRIIYFPNGVYLVSDTVAYTLENFHNTLGNELNRGIRLVGESRDGVRIKLKDFCPGFGVGAAKPVVSFQRGRRSNIAMSNYLENLTVDVGTGNAGAIGVVFFANNTGAVRNVTIRSSDPAGRGDTGFAILHELASGLLVRDLEVRGFDFGVRVEPMRMYTVFDSIMLIGQRDAGFAVGNNVVSIRRIRSENDVPAVVTTGPLSHVVIADGEFEGGDSRTPALNLALGVVHLRNIRTAGYNHAATVHGAVAVPGPTIEEYGTHAGRCLFADEPPATLDLPVESPPPLEWECDARHWASVNRFGAIGDGVNDDTAAVQRAMNSGASVVYFEPGKYLLNASIEVPATVKRLNFMFVDLVAGARLKEQRESGTFRVAGESDVPLVIEDLFAWEAYHGFQSLVDHACRRTVVLRDLHAQTGALYRNSVPGGKVFIENCCCTIGSRGIAEDKGRYGHVPCFEFTGQRVWAWQINPERSHTEILNHGSRVWIMGFKTEGFGSAVVTRAGGVTEVLGGVLNIGKGKIVPAFDTTDGEISVIATTNGYSTDQFFPVAARETRGGDSRTLLAADLPRRFASQYHIPLYSSRRAGKNVAK